MRLVTVGKTGILFSISTLFSPQKHCRDNSNNVNAIHELYSENELAAKDHHVE